MEELARHKQGPSSCRIGDPSLKEGINDAQWAILHAQSRMTGNNQIHRTQRWAEIWKVLFPDKEAPTPCKYMHSNQHNCSPLNLAPGHEDIITSTFSNRPVANTEQIEDFISMCMKIMETNARDLVSERGELTTEVLKRLLRQGCTIWAGLHIQLLESQASSSLTGSGHPSSIAPSSTTIPTAPTAYTSFYHGLDQTSGSNAQSALGSRNTDMNQTGLTDTSPSNTALANMVGTGPGLQLFQPTIPTSLPSGLSPMETSPMGTNPMDAFHEASWLRSNSYYPPPSDSYYTPPSNSFYRPPSNSYYPPSSNSYYPPPSNSYYPWVPNGLPRDESGYYQQAQDFGLGANMNEDRRSSGYYQQAQDFGLGANMNEDRKSSGYYQQAQDFGLGADMKEDRKSSQ
jgi:hypothetical protein